MLVARGAGARAAAAAPPAAAPPFAFLLAAQVRRVLGMAERAPKAVALVIAAILFRACLRLLEGRRLEPGRCESGFGLSTQRPRLGASGVTMR
jgi:hypothetical protein